MTKRPSSDGPRPQRPTLTTMAPWPLGEPIPAVCTVTEVLRILRLSRRTFERLMQRGQLALVELAPLGRLRRFDGDSVAALKRGRFAPRVVAHPRRA